jgi:dihydrofolate synthase / folylpolyglutamate synthase
VNYREALAWLYGTQRFGIKLGLENVRRLFGALHIPAPGEQIIHVAGTNGKGSVCAMLDSMLRAGGHRTGLFTSPHLVTFRERLRVDGEMISEEATARGLTSICQLVASWDPHPTFFEIVTALALQHFHETRCEFVVLETGMGGRLDATNATQPIVSVITPIALDHQKWLGHSLAEIAGEKAGIINTPVVSAPQSAEAEAVIRARAAECAAPLLFVGENSAFPVTLAGAHQKRNAALATAALRAGKITIDDDAMARGLGAVQWPARFQRWNERIIMDGAHNPAGMETLLQTWREYFGDDRAIIVFATLQDKDYRTMLGTLSSIAHRFIFPKIRSERAAPTDELARVVSSITSPLPCSITPSTSDALASVRAEPGRVLLTGSLHFAGEALACLRGEPAAYEECLQ